MFTTKSNLEKESGIGCKVSFLSELQDSAILHPLSSEHFLRVCLQIVLPFLASVSVILPWKTAVLACILEARLEKERRRLAEEEVGQGSGVCGLVS